MSISQHENLKVWAPLLLALALGPVAACSPSTADRADIQRAITGLRSPDRVEKALGAIAAQHVIDRQSRLSLFDHTEPRWWQRELQPAVPRLIDMLSDDAGLEWIDPSGNTEKVTTPRKEAALALVRLERVAVGPLIEAQARADVARRAREVLREITGGKVSWPDAGSWRTWWDQRQREALPRERGRIGDVFIRLVWVLAGVALVIVVQEMLARRATRRRLSFKKEEGVKYP